MQTKTEEIKLGRPLGSTCRVCRQDQVTGKSLRLLMPVYVEDKGSNRVIGPGGRSWHHFLLERLGCFACGLSYEAQDRGINRDEYVRKQERGFVNPAEPPSACMVCELPLHKLSDGRHPMISHEELVGRATTLHYCPCCLRLRYVERTDPLSTKEF